MKAIAVAGETKQGSGDRGGGRLYDCSRASFSFCTVVFLLLSWVLGDSAWVDAELVLREVSEVVEVSSDLLMDVFKGSLLGVVWMVVSVLSWVSGARSLSRKLGGRSSIICTNCTNRKP